jgi:hypothetical protein
MSIHPNAILLLTITPEDLARKTYRAILDDAKVEDDGDIKIDGVDYHHRVMEEEYDESYQISAKEGDIALFDLVTYGYGETIEWAKLEAQKNNLEAWAKGVCEKHHCTYKIFITANYW